MSATVLPNALASAAIFAVVMVLPAPRGPLIIARVGDSRSHKGACVLTSQAVSSSDERVVGESFLLNGLSRDSPTDLVYSGGEGLHLTPQISTEGRGSFPIVPCRSQFDELCLENLELIQETRKQLNLSGLHHGGFRVLSIRLRPSGMT